MLGQYQPPVMNIVRNPENDKIRANAQLYINGFKTNKERVAVKILIYRIGWRKIKY